MKDLQGKSCLKEEAPASWGESWPVPQDSQPTHARRWIHSPSHRILAACTKSISIRTPSQLNFQIVLSTAILPNPRPNYISLTQKRTMAAIDHINL